MKKQILLVVGMLASAGAFSQAGQKWATGGNSVSNGDFIGTTNNFPLDFRTNNNQRMLLGADGNLTINNLSGTGNRVLLSNATGQLYSLPAGVPGQFLQADGSWASLPGGANAWQVNGANIVNTNAGFVGIGTTNPTERLSVGGNVTVSGNLLVGGGVITTNSLNSTVKINAGDIDVSNNLNVTAFSTFNNTANFNGAMRSAQLSNGNTYQPVFVGPNGVLTTLSAVANQFQSTSCNPLNPSWQIGGNALTGTGLTDPSVGTCDDVQFGIKVNGQNKIYFSNSGNSYNIGFGTTLPSQKYHFNGGNIMLTGGNMILDGNNAPSNQTRLDIQAGNNTGLAVTINPSLKALAVVDNGSSAETFKVYGDGKTHIGTLVQTGTHSDAMLTVNGKMVAKSCYVTLNSWADYVFDKNYKMPDLYEVEKYYLKNKHLPEIPSENEIIEKGVDVAEMNKLLLKKIEELTILMVNQQKEIDALKQKVN